jgi:Protein of unknown function (DUF4239)
MAPSTFLNWLGSISFDVAFILVVLPTILIAMLGTLVVRIVFAGQLTPSSAVGPTKNQVAAQIYAVVLGFILVYGFSEFNDARQNVLKEAATLGRLIAQAPLAGDDAGQAIAAAVIGYSETVAFKEWPLMAHGGESVEALNWLRTLDRAILSVGSSYEGVVRMRLSALVDEVVTRRVDRIAAGPDPDLSVVIFELLAVAAALAIATGWFLRGPSVLVHTLLVGMISSSVITMMVLSAQLLYPFSGSISISPEPFVALAKAGGN